MELVQQPRCGSYRLMCFFGGWRPHNQCHSQQVPHRVTIISRGRIPALPAHVLGAQVEPPSQFGMVEIWAVLVIARPIRPFARSRFPVSTYMPSNVVRTTDERRKRPRVDNAFNSVSKMGCLDRCSLKIGFEAGQAGVKWVLCHLHHSPYRPKSPVATAPLVRL